MLARARIDVCCSVVTLGLLGVTANLDDCPGAGADADWLLGAVIGCNGVVTAGRLLGRSGTRGCHAPG